MLIYMISIDKILNLIQGQGYKVKVKYANLFLLRTLVVEMPECGLHKYTIANQLTLLALFPNKSSLDSSFIALNISLNMPKLRPN